ncbi:Protein of unknown function [Nonlabens sp. Hel1_33_55]|uniref:DUF3124 domain-containing protein n=1 Tax=Nonlabens sp. Hel1_33_55 TaxID=1336802 RepID=UPI000875B9A8|nr:DUF3124 domain-containing protein [Nonlabens sp. Hel1_33_55]SCY23473.1 Protein of unknown function [Nonlabens sp. Hel1_33_55]
MKRLFIISLLVLAASCEHMDPNISAERTVEQQSLSEAQIRPLDSTMARQKVYVPIYSDIYQKSRYDRTYLTATFSIRNTSERDSLFLNRVDYFDTRGTKVRDYIDKTIYLQPLETIEFIIEENDTLGGSGANFMLEWYGKKTMRPVFQAVMIGGLGNKVFSFTTEGVAVDE